MDNKELKEYMNSTSRVLITSDTLKTIVQGALGAMTFGAYSQYINNKTMELNNRYFEDKISEIKKENNEIKKENNEIKKENNEIKNLLNKRCKWF